MTKISNCWSWVVHYQTWLSFTYTNLSMRNYILSQREIKTCSRNFELTSLVVHLSFLRANQMLMKLLSESLQTIAKLYVSSSCQPMTTGLYTRLDIDSETSSFTPWQNKTLSFENRVMSQFQCSKPGCKIESFHTTGRQKKIDRFSNDGFCSHCNTVFEAMGCSYHFCPCQELRPSLTEEDIQRGSTKKELDELRPGYIQEKGFTVIGMWKCEWWKFYKTTTNAKLLVQESFSYRWSLTEHQRLERIKSGNLFG